VANYVSTPLSWFDLVAITDSRVGLGARADAEFGEDLAEVVMGSTDASTKASPYF